MTSTITRRKAAERGHANHGWLDTWHTFSFADYYDPRHMGFRSLRVINDDRVAPSSGFPTHPHRDMEILTYVMEGELTHQDSMGHREVLRAGEVQTMTAGRGVRHSEFNDSAVKPVHLLQIWIETDTPGLVPAYAQGPAPTGPGLHLVAAPGGGDGVLPIHQDARVYLGRFASGVTLEHRLASDRHAWVHVARGQVRLNGTPLEGGDGVALSGVETLRLEADEPAEVLLFDLA